MQARTHSAHTPPLLTPYYAGASPGMAASAGHACACHPAAQPHARPASCDLRSPDSSSALSRSAGTTGAHPAVGAALQFRDAFRLYDAVRWPHSAQANESKQRPATPVAPRRRNRTRLTRRERQRLPEGIRHRQGWRHPSVGIGARVGRHHNLDSLG